MQRPRYGRRYRRPVYLAVLCGLRCQPASPNGLLPVAMGCDRAGVIMILLRRRHSASEHLVPEVQAMGVLVATSGRPDDDGYIVLCGQGAGFVVNAGAADSGRGGYA